MNNYQYEFITTLQYRVKNLQAQVDAFKNGSKYLQMDAQYKSMLHTEECRIHKLEVELSKAHAQTIDVRNKWWDTIEDVYKDHQKEIAAKDANRENEYNINAYLMSDENDVSIKVVVFEGDNKSVMSKRTEYGKKCLLMSISEVLEYFSSINSTHVDVSGSQRKEQTLFDFLSFREAWINACLHNDWNEGIAPSVYMFDDRIEIVSYGGLPYSLSREGFFNGTSVPVNKSLLMIFMASKYAEQSGHGVPTIVEKYGREVFSFDDGMIKVSIPLAYDREEVTERKNRVSLRKGLTKNQEQVLDYLKNNPMATLQEAASGCELSLGGVKKICSKLQEIGVLGREGSKRDGRWIVK